MCTLLLFFAKRCGICHSLEKNVLWLLFQSITFNTVSEDLFYIQFPFFFFSKGLGKEGRIRNGFTGYSHCSFSSSFHFSLLINPLSYSLYYCVHHACPKYLEDSKMLSINRQKQ